MILRAVWILRGDFIGFSDITSQFNYDVIVGPIAQSVEQRTFNPWVDGSSPSGPTFDFIKV
jgi:hypothetical protein